MSSSGRSRRSQMDSSSVASSDGLLDDSVSIDTERDEVKRKSRNLSEKKRRDQFNMLINELCSMVNLNPNNDVGCQGSKKMDKSSVLRATISFLKTHQSEENENNRRESGDDSSHSESIASNHSLINSWKPSFLSTEEFSYLSLEALDAFILVFETDPSGRILYASESILPLLGVSSSTILSKQLSMNIENNCDGQEVPISSSEKDVSVYDLVHDSERSALRKLVLESMNCPRNEGFGKSYVSMMIHFRHQSSAPDRETNESCSTYELVRIVGSNLRIENSSGLQCGSCFVSICRLQTPKLLKELHVLIPFNDSYGSSSSRANEFVSRHSLEWKFLYLDHRAPTIIGYLPFEVLGTSGYDYYHWDDLDLVVAGHQQLMQTGTSTSCHYRFLTKGQQWIWLKTKYYITYHMWNSKPEFVVCTHTVIGYDERVGSQLRCAPVDTAEESQPTSLRPQHITTQNNHQTFEIPQVLHTPTQPHQQQTMHNSQSLSTASTLRSTTLTASTPNMAKDNKNWEMLSPTSFTEAERSNPSSIYISCGKSEMNFSVSSNNESSGDPLIPIDYEKSTVPYSATTSTSSMFQGTTTNEPCPSMASSPSSSSDYVLNSSNLFEPPHCLMNPNQPSQPADMNSLTNNPVTSMVTEDSVNLQSYSHHLQPDQSTAKIENPNPLTSASNLQNFLRRKHQLLQFQIKEQQEELKRVSEQLQMVQVVGNNTSADMAESTDLQNQSTLSRLPTIASDIDPMTEVENSMMRPAMIGNTNPNDQFAVLPNIVLNDSGSGEATYSKNPPLLHASYDYPIK